MQVAKKPLTRKQKLSKWIEILVGLIVGGTVGYLAASIFFNFGQEDIAFPWYYKLLVVPLIPIALWVAVAAHELGHVLGGLSQKFEFKLLTIGPLLIENEAGKLKLRRNTIVNSFGGLALCLPDDQRNLTARYIKFIVGGPAGSFVWGGILLVALLTLQLNTANLFHYLLQALLVLSCALSFVVGIVALLPIRAEGFTSDGGKLQILLGGGPAATIETTMLHYFTATCAGTRPAALDPKSLEHAIAIEGHFENKYYLHAMLYGHYLDAGLLEKAEEHLNAYTVGAEELQKGLRAMVFLEKAWFEARYYKRVELAKDFLKKEKPSPLISKALVLRAEAAIAYAEDDFTLAIEKCNQAIQELPKMMDKGGAIAEKEWLEELIVICEHLQNASP
jgi:hypothetical protein